MIINISKLNLNKKERVVINLPFKNNITINYIISDKKEILDCFIKETNEKIVAENGNIIKVYENDKINEDDFWEEGEFNENEIKTKIISKSNHKKNDIDIDNNTKDLHASKKSKTNILFKKFAINDDSKLDYSKIKLTPSENIIFLKPQKINNNINLNIEKENEEIYDTFCQGFFIASFPKKDGKIIENSKNYRSTCGHLICGKLPAMESEIIYKYPFKENIDLELNNLCSSICFPTGIKVCYNQDRRSTYKSFSTHIVNQKGKKYYFSIYHFYYKLDITTYNKLYSDNPLKNYLKKFDDHNYSDEEKLTLEKELEQYKELGFRENVYIPHSIVLISKYPYIKQMKTVLNNVFIILTNHKNILNTDNKELNDLFNSIINDIIAYVVKIIPIPKYNNTSLIFNLPFDTNKIEILSPNKNNIRNILNVNFSLLLNYFSIDNIIKIYRLILFEKKLLFIDKDYNRLHSIIESFTYLLYPLEWVNLNIPIMSHQMTRYLQTFLPFINGISEDLYDKNALNVLNVCEERVYEIHIIKDKIKCRRKEITILDNVPEIPNLIYKKLDNELHQLKELYNNLNLNDKNQYFKPINNIFSNIFFEANAIMWFDFIDLIFNVNEGNNKIDNKLFKCMVKKKYDKKDISFYNDLIDTQIFSYFITNVIYNKNEYTTFFNMFKNIHEKYIISQNKEQPTKWKNIIRSLKLNDITNNKKSTLFNIPNHLKNLSLYNSIKKTYVINYDKWSKINKHYFNIKNEDNIVIYNDNIIDNKNKEYISETDRICLNKFEINNDLYLNEDDYEKYIIPNNNEDNNYNEKSNESLYRDIRAITLTSLNKNDDIFEDKINIEYIVPKNLHISRQKSKILINLKNELEFKDIEKENIKNNFQTTLTKLFQDESDVSIEECIQNVYYNIGRQYFCEMIFQKGFKVTQKMKDKCFLLLKKIFLNALISICNINENQEILDFAVKITQAGFYYCKESNNNILIIDELRNSLGSDYFMWIQKSFWNNWQNIENYFSTSNYNVYCDIIKGEFIYKLLRIKIDKEFIINYLKGCLEEKMKLMQESLTDDKKENKEYNDLYLKTKIEIIKIVSKEKY